MKQQLGTNNSADEKPIKMFVAKYFKEADDELRSGSANPGTIKKLLNASYLIDMTSVFGPLAKETVQRKTFAKTYAVKLSKNLKAGRDINEGLNFGGQAAPTQQ